MVFYEQPEGKHKSGHPAGSHYKALETEEDKDLAMLQAISLFGKCCKTLVHGKSQSVVAEIVVHGKWHTVWYKCAVLAIIC